MTVRRLGLYNSQANASHSIAQVNDPFLVSVVATNTIEEPALIRVWVVPSLATQESQYSYITYDIELDPGNTLETHRFALNSLDTVRVRANKTGISFSCSGIPQTGPIPADEVQTLTNKTISGLNNTLTDIGNSSLVNDSITLMGEEIELGEVVANLDYFQFDTAATPSAAVGRVSWNDGEGTANITLKGGNISLPIGQEEVVLCYNGSGLPLTKGTVVYINGAQGQRPRITKASASGESTSSKTLGMVSESIDIGGEGFVTTFGVLKGINTITYAEGAALWLSTTAGEVTTTMPTAPNHAVFIGYCVRSHATAGQIFIKVQNGYELEELHNVLISSPIGGQGLVYESSTGLWKNQNVDALPSQTGNSGKYLTTNGTVASWGTIDLSSYATIAYVDSVAPTALDGGEPLDTGLITYDGGDP